MKKKLLMMRMKRTQLIFYSIRQMQENNAAILEAMEEAREKKPEGKDDEIIWSARTQDIRNRLTGKKRQAEERWNRFAGTESAGAKGR